MKPTIWTAADAARATGGKNTAHWSATNVTIDSRTLEPGDLFIAIRGERVDGHTFVADALARGAAAAMVSKVPAGVSSTAPLLVVPDTDEGLRNLAAFNRKRTHAVVFGVTGSVGKTSTRHMLQSCLADQGMVHASKGNLNNHYGVPLSMSRMPESVKYAVFEMGMNHAGEIAHLTHQVRPHVAIITNVEPVHLEFFASVEEIARAKSEIFQGMLPEGVAVLNRDNPYFSIMKEEAEKAGLRTIYSFGEHEEAMYRLLNYTPEAEGGMVEASVAGNRVTYRLGLAGHHQARNSLAVLAAVAAGGGDITRAVETLASLQAPDGRGGRAEVHKNGVTFTVIDDSYNASPASIKAALAVMGSLPCEGRRIAVLGDMRELGPSGPELHKALLEAVLAAKVDKVIAVGPLMRHLFDALPEDKRLRHVEKVEALMPGVLEEFGEGDMVLVKGSHGVGMYRLAAFMIADEKVEKAVNAL